MTTVMMHGFGAAFIFTSLVSLVALHHRECGTTLDRLGFFLAGVGSAALAGVLLSGISAP